MVALTINAQQLAKLQKSLATIKNGVPKALVPAINRALDSGKTTVKREIREEYVIKAKDIPIKKKGANRATLGGALVIQQGMLPLEKFELKGGVWRGKRSSPLYARVKVGGGGTIATGFRLAGFGKAYRREGPERYPIQRLMAIGAPIMASQPAVGPAVNKAMGDTLDKRIDHEIKRVLASAGGKT
jgi:hypothetical protein